MTRSRPKGEHEAMLDVRSQWKCSICGLETNSSTGLRKHVREDHNKCVRCRIMFESAEEFHEHLLRANCSQKLCFVCRLDFASETSLSEHRLSCHQHPPDDGGDDDDFLVVTTRMSIAAPDENEDDVSHSDSEHVCDFCSQSFSVEEKLEAHLQREHFYCFPCSREFSHEKPFLDHLRSSSRHHYCSTCETDFLTSGALRKHRFSAIHENPDELRIPRPSSAIRWHDDAEHLRRYLESKQRKIGKARKSHQDDDHDHEHHHHHHQDEAESDEYAKLADRLSRLTSFLDQLEDCNPEYANVVKIQKLTDGFRLPPSSSEREDDSSSSSSDTTTKRTMIRDEQEQFCCSLCQEEFKSRLDREFHEYDNHQWCSVCNKQYASRRVIIEHILSTRGHHFCFECCKVFFLKEMLVDHRKSAWHSSSLNKPLIMSDKGVRKKVFVCDCCHVYNVYNSEHALQRHLDTNHFSCLECDRCFKSRKALIQHYVRSKRHHFCSECEMNLPSRLEMDEHIILGRHRD